MGWYRNVLYVLTLNLLLTVYFNFKVTLIRNLESYGIDPQEFAHNIQIKAATSTSGNNQCLVLGRVVCRGRWGITPGKKVGNTPVGGGGV